MAKQIATIPLLSIEKIQIYMSNCTKTLAQVKSATNADYVLNGGMWNPDGSPCRGLKVDGKLLSATPWDGIPGYGWNSPLDFIMTNNWNQYNNYIACSQLLRDHKKLSISYDKAQGGTRGRTAIALKSNNLILYASQDGSSDAKTPEKLQEELYNLGCESAIMLDSGGSSQCDFKGKQIKGDGRKCDNYICVYLKKEETSIDKDKEGNKVDKTYRVTATIGVNIRSGAGASYSKVGAYPYNTIINITEEKDGWGKTNLGWVSLDYCEEVSTASATRITDNGIEIKQMLIGSSMKNRPGGTNPMTSVTIHETGNFSKGADAEAHGKYLNSSSGEASYSSWHYTVDDHAIVQHVPDNEYSYHAGDGANGKGNTTSISIEICVNADGDFEKAKRNAASLVRLLKTEHPSIASIVQHNHWNGKDCPYTIRHTNSWDNFLAMCDEVKEDASTYQEADSWAKESWLKAYNLGITDGSNPKTNITRQDTIVLLDRLGLLK